jgi:hypothetical protein
MNEDRISLPDPDDDVELQRALLKALDQQMFDYSGREVDTGEGTLTPTPAPAPPRSVRDSQEVMQAIIPAQTQAPPVKDLAEEDLLNAAIAMSINDTEVDTENISAATVDGQSEEEMIAEAIAASLA